jgi:hypothetical protein
MRPFGRCRLCLRDAMLCSSHLLPKAMYKTLRSRTARNPNPLLIGYRVLRQTSLQLKTYLLCDECEQRFQARGERWVLANCYRAGGVFALRNILERFAPLSNDPQIRVYSAASIREIDSESLIYFALSVLWRAAVHEWRIGGLRVNISLGPYEEKIRRFLMDESGFPEQASLQVLVGIESRMSEIAFNPVSGNDDGFHHHKFGIPGITFLFFVGGRLPRDYVSASFAPAPEHYLSIYPTAEQRQLSELYRLFRSARQWTPV